jgi:hypothetical protein
MKTSRALSVVCLLALAGRCLTSRAQGRCRNLSGRPALTDGLGHQPGILAMILLPAVRHTYTGVSVLHTAVLEQEQLVGSRVT